LELLLNLFQFVYRRHLRLIGPSQLIIWICFSQFVGGAAGVGVMTMLQRDIVKIYNFDDRSHILLSKSLGNIFYEVATGLPVKWIVRFAPSQAPSLLASC
jgi:hypothetical protein